MKNLEVTEGDFIYVLGFPMGIVAKDRQYVILRQGVIARIRDLFENRNTDFVVDAVVFPGNSGGPVILKPEVISITGTKSNPKAGLIGIIKSYIPYQDVAISQQTNRPRVVFEENSGLSLVEPVDHILETIIEDEKSKNVA
jgi:S1-C subfamily serine protease